jgi:UDP-glucose 4-epimerase
MRKVLDWTPQYDNLGTIAAHALAWEEKLLRDSEARHAASA